MPRLVFDTVPKNELNALPRLPETLSPSSLQKSFTQALPRYKTAIAPFWPNMRRRLVRTGSGVAGVTASAASVISPAEQGSADEIPKYKNRKLNARQPVVGHVLMRRICSIFSPGRSL